MQQQQFHYWAFISYSSKDRLIAERLHKKLETYKVPRDLVGIPGRDEPIPAKLFPIFRDRDELPLSSNLGNSIHDALKASRYLLVLCSPHSAKSQWVNEEIRYFRSLGRSERVLALIVDGLPEQSFPPALKFGIDTNGQLTDIPEEPIAGDLQKSGDGWDLAFAKAIAGITGLGLDQIVKREQRRKRQKQWISGIICTLLMILGSAVWDGFYRTHTEYYAFATNSFGDYFGQYQVPAGALKNSIAVVQFSRPGRFGKTSHLTVVDQNKQPIEPIYPIISGSILGQQLKTNYSGVNDKPVTAVKLTRDDDGNILKESAYYFDQSLAYEFYYVDENTVSFQNLGVEQQRAPGIASRARIKYFMDGPAKGFLQEARFIDAYGNPAKRDLGAAFDEVNVGLYAMQTQLENADAETFTLRLYLLGKDDEKLQSIEMSSILITVRTNGVPYKIVTEAIDRETGGRFSSMELVLNYTPAGTVTSIESIQRASLHDTPLTTVMHINALKQRFEMELPGMDMHVYLGNVGRQMLATWRFDSIGFGYHQGQLNSVFLYPSNNYVTGFYQIPNYPFILSTNQTEHSHNSFVIGDIIISYDEFEIDHPNALYEAVNKTVDLISKAEVRVLRDGKIHVLQMPRGSLNAELAETLSMTLQQWQGN